MELVDFIEKTAKKAKNGQKFRPRSNNAKKSFSIRRARSEKRSSSVRFATFLNVYGASSGSEVYTVVYLPLNHLNKGPRIKDLQRHFFVKISLNSSTPGTRQCKVGQ